MRLYKGVFWMADKPYLFRIPCDTKGNVIGQTQYPLNSKNRMNYNHKLLWESLPKCMTGGRSFDYYPRRRVEIRNAKATVYLNPDLDAETIRSLIIDRFGLIEENGIRSVKFISDGSNHYHYKSND